MAAATRKFGTRSGGASAPKPKTKLGFVQKTWSPAHMRQPRPPGLIQRPKKYTKSELQNDPTQFGNISFGRTGLTGES